MWVVFETGIVANNGTGEVSVDQYHRYPVNLWLPNELHINLVYTDEILMGFDVSARY